MVLKNWTQKKGVCASALDSFLKMVDLERCGRSFFMRFFCLFFAEEPYFFIHGYWYRGNRSRLLDYIRKRSVWNSRQTIDWTYGGCIMDKISELLQYVRRTNPEMTRERLIEELSKSDYVARSINFTKENFSACHPKSIFFWYPLPCHFSAGIWKLKILYFVRQTCNYLALSELRDNLWFWIGMIWTGKNCAANKHATSGYLTAYTYLLRVSATYCATLKNALYTILCALYEVVNVQVCLPFQARCAICL